MLMVMAIKPKPKQAAEPSVSAEYLRSFPWLTIEPGGSFIIPNVTLKDVRWYRSGAETLLGIDLVARTLKGGGVYISRVPE